MARCGCGSTCLCVLADGSCTHVIGSGSVSSPYKTNVLISVLADNQLECVPGDGLYVPDGDVEHLDTNCIQMTGDGSVLTPLLSTLVVDAVDICNLSSCGANGLLTKVFTADGECVAITGCGTSGDPLVPEIVLDPDPANVIVCNPGLGLFAPAAAAGAIQYEGEITFSVPQDFPAAVTQTTGVLLFDTVVNDLGVVTDIANNRFLIPVGGAGWYAIDVSINSDGPDFGLSGASAGGYQLAINIRINGSGNLRFGACSEEVVNASPGPSRQTQAVNTGIFLAAADTVDFFFAFQDQVNGGLVGIQRVEANSYAKIVQIGV